MGIQFTIQISIRGVGGGGVNIPWMKIDPEVNIPWESKYHRTPVGCFTLPSACVGFCTSGPQSGVKCKLCIVWGFPEIFPVCPDVD